MLVLIAWGSTAAGPGINTRVINEYRTSDQQETLAVRYETELKSKHDGASQPRVTSIRYEIDLVPETRSLELRGTETLLNRDTVPQSELYLNLADGF